MSASQAAFKLSNASNAIRVHSKRTSSKAIESSLSVSILVSVLADEILKNVAYDALRIVVNKFRSVISFVPTVSTMLSPEIVEREAESGGKLGDLDSYEVEGGETKAEILQNLAEFQFSCVMFNAVLENACSEQGARMSAMDSSSRHASDMLDRLTLTYNRYFITYVQYYNFCKLLHPRVNFVGLRLFMEFLGGYVCFLGVIIVFLFQKASLYKCNMAGKPAVVTRVVDSMTDNLRPTCVEVTDVANAVLDGILLCLILFLSLPPLLSFPEHLCYLGMAKILYSNFLKP
ncbi:hypothetical protein CRYUN_Cryun39dG0082200 [Craigia yunnanensis]